jgi:hypothetical protein
VLPSDWIFVDSTSSLDNFSIELAVPFEEPRAKCLDASNGSIQFSVSPTADTATPLKRIEGNPQATDEVLDRDARLSPRR